MIAKEYNKLKRTPSGQQHSDQWDVVKRAIYENQREFVLICIDPGVTDKVKLDLISIAGHGGSVALKDNWPVVPLLQEVYADELTPPSIMRHLDWLVRVHGYPLKK